jgi:hypothetical protein
MRRRIDRTEPSIESDRDTIGRARTLTPEELGEVATDRNGLEIRRMGFKLSGRILRR